MGSVSIASNFSGMTAEKLEDAFESAKQRYRQNNKTDEKPLKELTSIFSVAVKNPKVFAKIMFKDDTTPSAEDYFFKWIKKYIKAYRHPASEKVAKPKGSCDDPAVEFLVKKYYGKGFTGKKSKEVSTHHKISMCAENILGLLLEEYIAKKITKYDFLWCRGAVLEAIDFCSKDGAIFLQIKNKDNTENSSSDNSHKENAPVDIEKWNRLSTKVVKGKPEPIYKWNELNDIVNRKQINNKKIILSEHGYRLFLSNVFRKNKRLLCDE